MPTPDETQQFLRAQLAEAEARVKRLRATLQAYQQHTRSDAGGRVGGPNRKSATATAPSLLDRIFALLPASGEPISLDEIENAAKAADIDAGRDSILAALSVLLKRRKSIARPGRGIYCRLESPSGNAAEIDERPTEANP